MAGGSSRKPFTRRDGYLTSSMHKVLSDDDLLTEILLRLPILSLHLFKPVCKQWLSLITCPSFTLRRTKIPTIYPPSGVFIGRQCPNEYNFVSFDPRIPSKRSILFSFNSKTNILQSCNGLLLCHIPCHGKYIYNPLTGMFKMLPPIHDPLNSFASLIYKIAFDPNKSPHYKVVCVAFGYSYKLQTYSSETGVWSVWDDQFPFYRFVAFSRAIYWNGAIHWLTYCEPHHVKLDIVDHPVLTSIQTPVSVPREHFEHKLFNSHGSLLLFCKDKNYHLSQYSSIYEMNIGNSEWLVKYSVNLDDMLRPFPTRRMPAWDSSHILSIFLGEGAEDSFMVFELFGKVLQYKFVSESVSKLLDLEKRGSPTCSPRVHCLFCSCVIMYVSHRLLR